MAYSEMKKMPVDIPINLCRNMIRKFINSVLKGLPFDLSHLIWNINQKHRYYYQGNPDHQYKSDKNIDYIQRGLINCMDTLKSIYRKNPLYL